MKVSCFYLNDLQRAVQNNDATVFVTLLLILDLGYTRNYRRHPNYIIGLPKALISSQNAYVQRCSLIRTSSFILLKDINMPLHHLSVKTNWLNKNDLIPLYLSRSITCELRNNDTVSKVCAVAQNKTKAICMFMSIYK